MRKKGAVSEVTDNEKIDAQMKMTLKAMAKPLSPGDLATEFELHDEDGRPFDSAADYLAGRPLILVFAPAAIDASSEAELKAFADRADRLRELGARLALLSLEADNDTLRALKQRLSFPGPAISDPTGRIFALYGLVKGDDIPGKTGLRTVVVSPQRRIAGVFDAPAMTEHAARCAEALLRASAVEENFIANHAPILIIPNLFAKRECDDLVAYYERESHIVDFDRNNPAMATQDTKTPIWEHNRQDRVDLVIKHPVTVNALNQRIFQVVAPLVKKAFGYQADKRESINIARYEGPRSGMAMGHRDNLHEGFRHRRFALTVALNNDFEGGEIVFREFSNHPYRVAAGTATVFSSSLLHEVLETTRGRRYVMISHLYSETPQ